jgi:hypothetical protein
VTAHILELPVRRWYCPNCKATDVTREARPHSRMHTCPALNHLTLPMDILMVPEGTKAKVTTNEREDYIGSEDVFLHAGRPIMNIVTERDNGRQDCAVFAPTAHAYIR